MSTNRETTRRGEVPVAKRLAAVIKNLPLDCDCRRRLDDALERFAALEERRNAREHVANALRQRERIEAILVFLKDLDDLTAIEADRSVYAEIALLFEDIATFAREGSDAMRKMS